MSFTHLFIATLLAAPLLAAAQERRPAPDPADAQAGKSNVRYESAFAGYRPYASPEQAPDKAWHEANRQVGALRGHAGHLADAPPRNAANVSAPASAPAGQKHH